MCSPVRFRAPLEQKIVELNEPVRPVVTGTGQCYHSIDSESEALITDQLEDPARSNLIYTRSK